MSYLMACQGAKKNSIISIFLARLRREAFFQCSNLIHLPTFSQMVSRTCPTVKLSSIWKRQSCILLGRDSTVKTMFPKLKNLQPASLSISFLQNALELWGRKFLKSRLFQSWNKRSTKQLTMTVLTVPSNILTFKSRFLLR